MIPIYVNRITILLFVKKKDIEETNIRRLQYFISSLFDQKCGICVGQLSAQSQQICAEPFYSPLNARTLGLTTIHGQYTAAMSNKSEIF